MDLGLRGENSLRVVATLSKKMLKIKVIGMGLIPSQRTALPLGSPLLTSHLKDYL